MIQEKAMKRLPHGFHPSRYYHIIQLYLRTTAVSPIISPNSESARASKKVAKRPIRRSERADAPHISAAVQGC